MTKLLKKLFKITFLANFLPKHEQKKVFYKLAMLLFRY